MNASLYDSSFSALDKDPIGEFDALLNRIHDEMTELGNAEQGDVIDWDSIINFPKPAVNVSAEKPAPASASSPAHSSGSEQSRALDVNNGLGYNAEHFDADLFVNGIDMPAPGIMHSASDLPAFNTAMFQPSLQAQAQPVNGMTDGNHLQMQGVLPFVSGAGLNDIVGLGDMVNLGNLGDMDLTNLGLADFVNQIGNSTAASAVPAAPAQPLGLQQAYDILGRLASSPASGAVNNGSQPGMAMPTSIQPSQLSLLATPSPVVNTPVLPVAPSLKRKASDAGSEASASASISGNGMAQVKRPRGRPPKPRADSGSLSLATPLGRADSIDGDEDDSAANTGAGPSAKRTASGKPSTARPKSVVPEKYFKDMTAQQITGMTMEQILQYPTYEDLLKHVAPELREGAEEFGKKIAENRDKAKDAAKKSREERKAKVETLEQTVEGLEDKIRGMQGVLMGLVRRGILSEADVLAYM